MHRERDRNARSKFVITGTEAWFTKAGDDAPELGEMLVAATGIDLEDEEEIREMDRRLEYGEVLIGYVSGCVVESHGPLIAPFPSVLARFKRVFGKVRISGLDWTMDTGAKS